MSIYLSIYQRDRIIVRFHFNTSIDWILLRSSEISLHGNLLVFWYYVLVSSTCYAVDAGDVWEVSTRAKTIIDDLPYVFGWLIGGLGNAACASFAVSSPEGLVASLLMRRYACTHLCILTIVHELVLLGLELVDAVESFLLHQQVHAIQPLVVLLEAADFSPGQGHIFVSEVDNPLQVLDLFLELSIFWLHIFAEGLLVLQVPSQSCNLAVPEIELVLLRTFRLAKHVNLLLEWLDLVDAVRQFLFQIINLILEHSSISSKSGFQRYSLLQALSWFHLAVLQLRLLPHQLFICQPFLLDPGRFFLFHVNQLILGRPQELCAFSKVFPEGLILESQLIKFPFHWIILSSGQVAVLISFEDVNLPLQLVVFSVQEINLTLELLYALFVLLVLILQIEFLQILGRLV